MVHMIPTMETISVVCLTEDQEDGDLILDLMVDWINKVSLVIGLFSHIYFTINKITANEIMYKMRTFTVYARFKDKCRFYQKTELKFTDVLISLNIREYRSCHQNWTIRETRKILYRRRKKTQFNMCRTPLCTNKHK
jgi:hypothetical protein